MSNFCHGFTTIDYDYVWAINGLNLREEPNKNSKLIKKLQFGDSLKIVELTPFKFTNLLIREAEPEKHPIYLKSNWVKVIANGKEGYLIDGYLLDLPCPEIDEKINDYLTRMSNRFNTIRLQEKFPIKSGIINFKTNQIIFSNDKRIDFEENKKDLKQNISTESESDYVAETFKYFRGFKLNEILVFLNPFIGLENKKDFELKVRRNWKEMIWMTDGAMQEIELSMLKNGVIIFYYNASC